MKKLIAVLAACLLACGQAAFAAAEGETAPWGMSAEAAERIRKAGSISWAGGEYVLADGELICTADNRTVLSSVTELLPWGGGILAELQDTGLYTVDPDGKAELMPICAGIDWPEYGYKAYDGLLILAEWEGRTLFFQSLKYGTALQAKEEDGWSVEGYEAFRDAESGDRYIVFCCVNKACSTEYRTAVYREDGSLAWEGPFHLVMNAQYHYETNGRLTGDNGERCVVLNAYTGEVTAVFDPGWYWRFYDGECEIFRDNTAVMDNYAEDRPAGSGCAVVSLDGETLIRCMSVSDRGAYTPGYHIDAEPDKSYFWSGETFLFTETEFDSGYNLIRGKTLRPEDMPESVYVNPILSDPETKSRFPFVAERSYTEILCGIKWEDAWPEEYDDGVNYSGAQKAFMQGWAAVMNGEGKWGVAGLDGEYILPPVYDSFMYTGYGYIARTGGETDFIGPELEPAMSTRGKPGT